MGPLSRFLVALVLVCSAKVVLAEPKTGFQPYSKELRTELAKSSSLYLLEFAADWCPTCKYQRQQLTKLMTEPAFRQVLIVEADYDTEENLKSEFKIRRQGTIIVMRGDTEVTREVLARDEETLRALLLQATPALSH